MADPFALAADLWEQRHRLWATPGDLAVDLDPTVNQTRALKVVDQRLVDLANGKGKPRLMVFMPPQEGKSQRVSRRWVEWLLNRDPTLRIGIVSYEKEIATRWGREVKRDIATYPELGIEIQADSRAADRWHTTFGGGVYSVGIGGALTGQALDVLIIDDPLKGRAEAESKATRDMNWDWWESVGSTRLSPRGIVVLMMTRWHEDDLAGRLLKREPGEWDVLSIPAIAKQKDPLGRRFGVELASATKKPGFFRKTKLLRSDYVFNSIYQQSPTNADGGTFKRSDWRYWKAATDDDQLATFWLDGMPVAINDCFRFVTIDLAASLKSRADWTVASAWAITPSGDMLLLDRVRERSAPSGHFDLITPLRQRWLGPYDVVYVESRMFGTTMVYNAGRNGVPIQELEADVDKLTRAIPAADMQRQHRLWLPSNVTWLDEWLDEHAEFPNGEYDDQVDTTGYAARVALAHWVSRFHDTSSVVASGGSASNKTDLDLMSVPL